MNDTSIANEIAGLLALGTEGGYWDYKERWHGNNADLLHDIICMSNNLENRDAYIIIGARDDGTVVGIPEERRKSQQMLIDFLKDVKFAGGIRPSVYVQTLNFQHQLDVIIIKNSVNTPYYLTDDYHGVFKGNIYVRVGDTNTPKIATADVDKVEYLWRKRFGIDLTPLEKVKFLLREPRNWLPVGTDGQHSNSQHNGHYYHKMHPEFSLRYVPNEKQSNENRIASVEHDFYWMNKLPMPLHNAFFYTVSVMFHSTVLFSTLAIFADNYRFKRVLWKKEALFENESGEYITYCYLEKGSIEYMLDNWLCNARETVYQTEEYPIYNPLEPWVSQPEYRGNNPYDVVPVFENPTEHASFIEYVKSQQSIFLASVGDYLFADSSHGARYNAPDYINYLCKCGNTLVTWLNEWRKQQENIPAL